MRRQRRRELRPPIGSTELPSIQRLDTWILRCGPSGDTPSVPPLKQQIWALRPGLDGGVPALHDNTKKREGWRFGDKRWLIAPTATSKLGAGRARPLGGAKGLSGAACGVSLGGSG